MSRTGKKQEENLFFKWQGASLSPESTFFELHISHLTSVSEVEKHIVTWKNIHVYFGRKKDRGLDLLF